MAAGLITATVHTARWTGRVRRHTGQPINPQHGQEPLTYLWYREGGGQAAKHTVQVDEIENGKSASPPA